MAQYPIITYRYPTLLDGVQSDLTPDIVFDWDVGMDSTYFSTNSSRAQYVVLMQEDTSTIIETSFVSYDASRRRVTLRPAENLLLGKMYRVVIKNKIASVDGRKSYDEFTWKFQMAGTSIENLSLLSPANFSVQASFPTLSWTSATATGTVTYQIEIDDRWDFGSLAYQASTSSTSILPAGSFTDETTYYWRVRAITDSATGAWSEVRSFFYGARIDSDVTSRTTYPDTDVFAVRTIGFVSGRSNFRSWPTLSITFNSTPASSYGDHISILSGSVLPRNDDDSTYVSSVVGGSWSLSGNTLTFTPNGAIENNTRYEILIQPTMVNTDGYLLGEGYRYYFSGKYTPYYVHRTAVRARMLGAEQHLPDDLIDFTIHMASLQANAKYYNYLSGGYLDSIDSLTEPLVRDSANQTTYSVLKWVEAVSTLKLLKSIWFEEIRNIGRTEKVGDGMRSLTADFVKGIKGLIDEIEKEIDDIENLLVPSDDPRMVIKNAGWHPDVRDYYDWSTTDLEARRGDLF